jgi:uncharacterized protein
MGRDHPCSHRRLSRPLLTALIDHRRSRTLRAGRVRFSLPRPAQSPSLELSELRRGGRRMTARHRNARGGWPLCAIRRFAGALGLLALCWASSAEADTISAGKRAFARHDYVRAASLLLVEAERGSPTAQAYLGYMYQYGLGVPQDYVRAASWLHQAAERGEPTAQFLLGLLFDKGFGVPMDWVEAEVWLNLAAAHAAGRQQDYFARIRDAVAQKLTLNQLAETQRRASSFTPIASPDPGPLTARY